MKRILFAAALAFFFTACALRSAVSLYNEGNDFYREGRFAEAGERYKEALEKDPRPRLAARIYFNAGNASVKEADASSGGAADLSSADAQNRLRRALELYCLAQACLGESFEAAAVNAEWVRVRLSGSGEESEKQNSDKEQDSSENGENSSGESDSADGEGNSSGEADSEGNGEDSSGAQDSRESESKDFGAPDFGADGENTPEEQNSFGNAAAASEERNDFGQEESGGEALSRAEAARMREAAELLEQEAAMRRQRPLFNRVPSYDDTERNW